MANEVEIKIRVGDPEEAAARVRALGATIVRARHFEDNRLYDREDGGLAQQRKLLRLRVVDGQGVLTVKAPAPGPTNSRFKVRREIETDVADPGAMKEALEMVGFLPRWRYQKYRRVWSLGAAHITLDEIRWGAWLEVEGEPEVIEEIERRLDWGEDRRDRGTYRDIHQRECAARSIPFGDLTFDAETPT